MTVDELIRRNGLEKMRAPLIPLKDESRIAHIKREEQHFQSMFVEDLSEMVRQIVGTPTRHQRECADERGLTI